jgi:FkbM family methyltransferase
MKEIRGYLHYIYNVLRKKEIWIRPQIKKEVLWLGNQYAGFYVVPELLNSNSIVYSFGVGEDISFDRALIEIFSCTIYAFDPTPNSIKYIKEQGNIENFNFSPVGIYKKDCSVDFFLPKNPNYVSGSIYHENTLEEKIPVPMKKIQTIFKELKHIKIDLIKLDIEGAEYDVMDDILDLGMNIPQILIELHHRFSTIGIAKTKDLLQKMYRAGYKIAAISPTHEEYTFVFIGNAVV